LIERTSPLQPRRRKCCFLADRPCGHKRARQEAAKCSAAGPCGLNARAKKPAPLNTRAPLPHEIPKCCKTATYETMEYHRDSPKSFAPRCSPARRNRSPIDGDREGPRAIVRDACRQDQCFLSAMLFGDALHRAGSDSKRLGHLQDTYTFVSCSHPDRSAKPMPPLECLSMSR
jgi:hypothetical protein